MTSRGNERREVFLDDEDRRRFLANLKDYHDRHGILIIAYVLMGNHYHLVLETPQGNLVKVMHGINSGYTGYFNRKYNRNGHLFQGRYTAILVEKETYLLELSRYVHLNPVRAGMVKMPEEYAWSSYPGYVNKGRALGWIEYGTVLSRYSEDTGIARKRYRQYVHSEVEGSLFRDVYGSMILGTEGFIVKVKQGMTIKPDNEVTGHRMMRDHLNPTDIIRAVAHAMGAEEAEVKQRGWGNTARNMAIYLIKKHTLLENRDIGELFGGVHYSTVSKTCSRFEDLISRDKKLARTAREVLSNAKT